jgi:hypothetical protein
MFQITWLDPRQTVAVESGLGLDAIGSIRGVDLPRDGSESDADYRGRLMVRLCCPLGSDLDPPVKYPI